MNVIIFGATGMVGQAVLRECLLDADVERVLAITRSASGQKHPKLREFLHQDFLDFSAIEREVSGFYACFFCLGVSSVGMTEQEYRRVTYDFTMAAAQTLVKLNPQMVFIYVSGAGTDSSETGRSMWARVKGRTENALLALPFRASYMFRPGGIQPLHGIKSKNRSIRVLYALTKPILPLLRLFPRYMTTTEQLGRAMLRVAKKGYSKRVLESVDINSV